MGINLLARRVVVCLAFVTCACASKSPRAFDAAAATAPPVQEPETHRSFILPVFEIIGFEAALNAVDRRLYDDGSFTVTPASIRRNLRGPWVIDDDSYEVNQFLHPYQGSIYHGLARSAGLNYWQSLAYTFGGSALWEIAGETTPPSKNDQIASGIAGTFFGESLFRTANLLIDKAGGRPGPGRLLLVALISPPTAFNRIVGGRRFDTVMETRDPMYDARMQLGTSGLLRRSAPGSPARLLRDESLFDLSLEYGLPGQTGYGYSRPFDYFKFQATASSENGLESVTSHGLLAGRHFDAGNNGRGLWGLFGVYDYLSPNLFRVSTTAVSLGTVTQWWSPRGIGFQMSAHGGVGWAAAQTLADESDYHYGIAPQGAIAFRLTGSDRIALDLSGRGYVVSDIGGYATPVNDVIIRGDASIGVRLFKRNAVSLRYLFNQRVASLANLTTTTRQRRETIGVYYTLLGPQGFGASRWKR
jgi:hypothetical protein